MAADSGLKYRAFISYSHGDEAWARWLQRSLERYRVPRRLRAEHPDLPKRLYPVFRDREELASSTDLSESIQQHMVQSEALIVVCSPAAAKSRWVNEEIRHYRSIGRADRIFCLLVDGSPERDAPECAFPPAMLNADDGTPLPEPLAADVHGDGKRGALLKIAAGLLGVGIDDLRQRDAQRQVRTWSAIAVGSMAIAVLTIGLAIVAYLAREESELRRGQAEDLISFMLGDLRGRLEPVGRLDVLDAVGDQAMDYFAALGERGTEDEVMARAMALRQIGEVRFSQGQLEPALEAFTESRDIARALHEAHPGNNDYLFELGQAEFWVGYVAWERNDLQGADSAFQAYRDVSVELAERAPSNPDYRLELMYSWSNLGSVARERADAEAALQAFTRVVAINDDLLTAAPDDDQLRFERAESLSWLGSAQFSAGDIVSSEQTLKHAVEALRDLAERDPNPRFAHELADNHMLLAEVQAHQGQLDNAIENAQAAIDIETRLVTRDPANARWREGLYRAQERQGQYTLSSGDVESAIGHLQSAEAGLEELLEADPTDIAREMRWARAAAYLALAQALSANRDAAKALLNRSEERLEHAVTSGSASLGESLEAAQTKLVQGDAWELLGAPQFAALSWNQGLAFLDRPSLEDPLYQGLRLGFHERLNSEESDAARSDLARVGFKDPRYLRTP